jgi:hypothetical protein
MKTHLQQTATAVAVNLRRFIAFVTDEHAPRGKRWTSTFGDLRFKLA